VDDAILVERQAQRIKESGGTARSDDTPETLKNRLAVYYQNTAPVIDYYRQQGKLVTVDGMAPIGDVTRQIAAAINSVAKGR
ncbi:MAG TPA: nucleoside monophosphate kinase, partial [Rhizomicrobium sp.]|nr:nucleoside monophosphate kinase [Rhizomicrobium sp.]